MTCEALPRTAAPSVLQDIVLVDRPHHGDC